MIARWPGTIPAGRTNDQPWAHWDLFPTLAEIAGARTPDGLDGRSMARLLRGQPQPPHEPMYWEFHERGFQQAVRMGDWKAVRLRKDAALELYNLADDPQEQRDVAAAHPEILQRIEQVLEDGANRVSALASQVRGFGEAYGSGLRAYGRARALPLMEGPASAGPGGLDSRQPWS